MPRRRQPEVRPTPDPALRAEEDDDESSEEAQDTALALPPIRGTELLPAETEAVNGQLSDDAVTAAGVRLLHAVVDGRIDNKRGETALKTLKFLADRSDSIRERLRQPGTAGAGAGAPTSAAGGPRAAFAHPIPGAAGGVVHGPPTAGLLDGVAGRRAPGDA